jgi:signal transduction histidine kinase
MGNIEAYNQVRPTWLSRVVDQQASWEGKQAAFVGFLSQFDACCTRGLEAGEMPDLQPVLTAWALALHKQKNHSLLVVLHQLLVLLQQTAAEVLEPTDAFRLMNTVLPLYLDAFEQAAQIDYELQVEHLLQDLEETRLNLERLEKSKADFISVAAHELKTPLTLIEGYSDMLGDLLGESGNADQIAVLLKGIDTGTLRLREIIDNLIDVSVIDNRMLSLNFQPVWLDRLFQILEGEFRHPLKERKLSFQVRNFSGSSEMIFGDADRLLQALRHLLSNAIKYTPDGGRVLIDGRKLPGFIEVTLADTGIGIDPKDHTRVFEKFGRLGNASLHSSGKTKFKGGGPGLGLPIAKGIIEAHGGAIWVESSGHDEVKCPGSTFHLLLPLRKKPPDEKIARFFQTGPENGVQRFNTLPVDLLE